MKTMYYLENETRQKLKDFHKEKADQRLRELAKVNNSHFSLFRLAYKMFARLASLPLRIIHPAHHSGEQVINLERSLDEA